MAEPEEDMSTDDYESRTVNLDEIRALLFGNNPNPNDVKRWKEQGFTFASDDIKSDVCFGLAQQNGGPCGVLVPIQALCLIKLLWTGECGTTKTETSFQFNLTTEKRRSLFLQTLADVLLQAAAGSEVVLAVGYEEKEAQCQAVTSREALEALLDTFYEVVYTSPLGVLLFVISLILTRKIGRIKADMDDPQPLVQRFGHCSQELLNLVITGAAVTNVFDGEKDVGGLIVNGIPKPFDVGYLTILEALRYSKVGENFKNPNFPVWVIGSSSHYTLLFSLDRQVGKKSPKENKLAEIKKVWNVMDPEENGILPKEYLPELLKQLNLTHFQDAVEQMIDPDNLGMLLWDNLVKSLSFGLVAELADTSSGGPQNFTLYHFNGIVRTDMKPKLTKVEVWSQGALQPNSGYGAQDLESTIKTKWPLALCEVTGPAKID